MRILVGTREVAGILHDFAGAFRSIGHQVTSVIMERHPFFQHLSYDVDLMRPVLDWPNGLARSSNPLAAALRSSAERGARLARLARLVLAHDVFVYFWAGESLRWNTELPYLRWLGKKIITVCCGSDIRHASAYSQEYAELIRQGSCRELRDLRPSERTKPLAFSLANLRAAELHSDVILSVPNQSGLAVRPYHHVFLPLDVSSFRSSIPGRMVPRVVHAPSNSGMKGSDQILPALERLKAEGVPLELQYLHDVTNAEVLRAMSEADVLVDQLHFPLHGKAGVEAMASGCALATCNRQVQEPFPPNRPIWHIDPGNVYEQLKRLLTDRELRVRLAEEGLAYISRYHDQQCVARRVLGHLGERGTATCDHYPTHFPCHYRLEQGVDIPVDLQKTTELVVRRWGLPELANPLDMVSRGLMTWSDAARQPARWPYADTTALD